MQACQPIRAVTGYTESHSRHAPSNREFKSEAKIRLGKWPFISKFIPLLWLVVGRFKRLSKCLCFPENVLSSC